MQMLLCTVAPNALETLIIETTDVHALLHAEAVQHRLELNEVWHVLADVLQPHPILQYALNLEHAWTEHELMGGTARYNTVVRTSMIYETLNTLEILDIIQDYLPKKMKTTQIYPFIWGQNPTQDIAALTLAFNQLQSFYYLVAEHNLAVLSLRGEALFAPRYL